MIGFCFPRPSFAAIVEALNRSFKGFSRSHSLQSASFYLKSLTVMMCIRRKLDAAFGRGKRLHDRVDDEKVNPQNDDRTVGMFLASGMWACRPFVIKCELQSAFFDTELELPEPPPAAARGPSARNASTHVSMRPLQCISRRDTMYTSARRKFEGAVVRRAPGSTDDVAVTGRILRVRFHPNGSHQMMALVENINTVFWNR